MRLTTPVLGAAILLGLGGLAWYGMRFLPPEWDPRAPLDLTAEPNMVTGLKLRRLRSSPEACFAAFEASRIPVTRVPDRPSEVGCGLENALRLPSALRILPSPPVVTCRVAAAWVLYERHALVPAGVAGVTHLGAQACRNVNRARHGRLSEHATANALDVAGFRMRDGRELRLARHWESENTLLRGLRDGACRWFGTVLGPEYNAAHSDHFHLDMGSARICR
ncbi:extensin family protein [Roseococcus sp. SYP-B2431]|uniref:extensin-like domain-containing protein n=1 Tax=Roseococcus sp. SYP-B2431 TaxID=2496640 RepID=UPI001F104EE6|nr:extensin family protein [Roseococcus sp. SYP-B2431]